MNVSEVKELAHLFDQSSIKSFDLKIDNVELHMSKNDQAIVQAVEKTAPTPVMEPVSSIEEGKTTPSVGNAESVSTLKEASDVAPTAEGQTVDSPIVGVVYLSSAPNQPVYKKVGDRVEVGETLCIVEAMKLMNEITSEIAGTVTEILVENEQVVEYGQPLFRIV